MGFSEEWGHIFGAKSSKTAYLKNRFFARNFHQTQKYEKVRTFFLSAFNGRFGGIGSGGLIAAVWELLSISGLKIWSFLAFFFEIRLKMSQILTLKWSTAPKRMRADPWTQYLKSDH